MMGRSERPAEPEEIVEWAIEHDWLAQNAAKVIGGYPGPRSPVGVAIRSWVSRHGWQAPGRYIARMIRAGIRTSADEFMNRIDRAFDDRIPVEALSLPAIYAIADAQAIGVCVVSRQRGLVRSMLGTIPSGALHPTECGWCAYPVEELLGWLREFNSWTATSPEGFASLQEWWRTDQTERVSAIGAAQSIA